MLTDIKFLSHKKHNPDFNIVTGRFDKDTIICYSRRIKFDHTKSEEEQPIEIMEIYKGINYVIGPKIKSYSRVYRKVKDFPIKYLKAWEELKSLYTKYALLD